MSTWWMYCKNIKKKFFTVAFWDNPYHLFWDLRSRDLKKILGYDINYLSIWPFMGHPWFPIRKASKLRFTCFQLAGEWHHPAIWKQSHGHHPASWKQTNLFRSLDLRSQISKQTTWIISKSHRENFFFLIFLQSIHQVDMKNVVRFS